MKRALLVLALVAGCAASTRNKALTDTLTAVDAARVAFVAYDGVHQQQIVAQATDAASGQAALVSYRSLQGKIEAVFVGAYQAIATAATLNTDASVATAKAALTSLQAELKQDGVTP